MDHAAGGTSQEKNRKNSFRPINCCPKTRKRWEMNEKARKNAGGQKKQKLMPKKKPTRRKGVKRIMISRSSSDRNAGNLGLRERKEEGLGEGKTEKRKP